MNNENSFGGLMLIVIFEETKTKQNESRTISKRLIVAV